MKKILLSLFAFFPVVSHVAQGQATETKTNEPSVLPAMTTEQILSFLEEKNHISNQQQIADVESFLTHFKKHTPPKEYPMIVQQVMAIDSAGKSKDKVFIPYLMNYFDYVSLNSSLISITKSGQLIAVPNVVSRSSLRLNPPCHRFVAPLTLTSLKGQQ